MDHARPPGAAVRLPRKGKEYPLADVVRLQYVSFTPVGLSRRTASYHGEPPQGELQLVTRAAEGVRVECVAHLHVRHAVQQFAAALRSAAGVPVARVYPTASGDWHVEPFDGADDDGAS